MLPWANRLNLENFLSFLNFASDPTQPLLNQPFTIGDRPSQISTDDLVVKGRPARYFFLQLYFDLYFAVRTREQANGSETVYTQRALTRWAFDGNGTVLNAIWTRAAGGIGNYGWSKFVEISNGWVVPITTPPNANVVTNDGTEKWSDENF